MIPLKDRQEMIREIESLSMLKKGKRSGLVRIIRNSSETFDEYFRREQAAGRYSDKMLKSLGRFQRFTLGAVDVS